MQRTILAIAIIVVLALGGGAIWLMTAERPSYLSEAMINVEGAEIGGPFELTTHKGDRIASQTLIDRPVLLYFGYTFCPDVCPVDTQVMADAVDLLDQKGIDVRPVFVTVDPARDTPKELGYFAEAIHPKMVGLTGTEADIADVAKAFKVYYQKVEVEGSAAGYLMNHTNYVYLLTPARGLVAMFRPRTPAEQIAADVEAVLGTL